MSDPSHETRQPYVEQCLQSDDRHDEYYAPSHDLGRREHDYEYRHDGDTRNEIEEVAHHSGDRQRRPGELEAFDHCGTAPDRRGPSRHALARVLKEEDPDDQEAEEVIDAALCVENVPEDEPIREDGEQRVEEHPTVAEDIPPRGTEVLGFGFRNDEMSTFPEAAEIAAETGPLPNWNQALTGHRRDGAQAEWIRHFGGFTGVNH